MRTGRGSAIPCTIAHNGRELASSVFYYPRWQQGLFCDAPQNQFRQHPLDYIEGLEQTIKECIRKAGGAVAASAVRAISVDTTGSTPVAVDESGTPLALLPGFELPLARVLEMADRFDQPKKAIKKPAGRRARSKTEPEHGQ